MMKPEDKVPLREQCQKLIELGVVLKTEKYWVLNNSGNYAILPMSDVVKKENDLHLNYHWITYPAPDIAELGKASGSYHVKPMYGIHKSWRLTAYGANSAIKLFHGDLTEAQARCAALIWLIENKYIKPENVTHSKT